MSLLQLLQQAQNGQGLSALAEQVGLDQAQAGDLTNLLAPVIGKAAKQQAESGGLDSILGALKGEAQAGLFDDAAQAASPEGAAQGANFLNGLLGDNGTNALAEQAAERTGIGMEQIMAFLPALGRDGARWSAKTNARCLDRCAASGAIAGGWWRPDGPCRWSSGRQPARRSGPVRADLTFGCRWRWVRCGRHHGKAIEVRLSPETPNCPPRQNGGQSTRS